MREQATRSAPRLPRSNRGRSEPATTYIGVTPSNRLWKRRPVTSGCSNEAPCNGDVITNRRSGCWIPDQEGDHQQDGCEYEDREGEGQQDRSSTLPGWQPGEEPQELAIGALIQTHEL